MLPLVATASHAESIATFHSQQQAPLFGDKLARALALEQLRKSWIKRPLIELSLVSVESLARPSGKTVCSRQRELGTSAQSDKWILNKVQHSVKPFYRVRVSTLDDTDTPASNQSWLVECNRSF